MLHVVCVKHGVKFSSLYVNRLYNMIRRHLSVPHDFWCFTENSNDIDPRIKIHTLPVHFPSYIQGWWWKPYLFADEHFEHSDTVLFFDLDMVIVNSIDHFVTYKPGAFVGLRDVSRVFNPARQKLGSAVMRWQAKTQDYLWTTLMHDSQITQLYRGDQEYLWDRAKQKIQFFPDIWIQSYKWEIRDRKDIVGKREHAHFKDIKQPEINDKTSVLAFHGYPSLETVKDPVITDNWT